MDINDFRGLSTALIFLAFIGISIWAYSKSVRKDFEECARLPLEDDHGEIR
ncbi:MAG: cbb3-type cytochrome c oxidase subunit 3 [Pseudomonadota bacterium]